MTDLPALDISRLPVPEANGRPLRFALLYGSARAGSFSHLLVEEAARLLRHLGGETRVFDPAELPIPGGAPGNNPKVAELHEALLWSDAQAWCSPENYGTLSAVMKVQLDSCPPVIAGEPLFGGKPLAVMQVCGAGANLNTSLSLATVGRWLAMFVTPSQLCVPHVQNEFDADGRMKASAHYDRLVDLVEELYKASVALHTDRAALLSHYSARKPQA